MLAKSTALTGNTPIRKRPITGKVAAVGAVLAAVGIAFSQFMPHSTHGTTDTKSDPITQAIDIVVPSANADDINSPTRDQSQLKDDKEYERYTINGHIQAF